MMLTKWIRFDVTVSSIFYKNTIKADNPNLYSMLFPVQSIFYYGCRTRNIRLPGGDLATHVPYNQYILLQ